MRIIGPEDAGSRPGQEVLVAHGTEAPLDANGGPAAFVGLIVGRHLVEEAAGGHFRNLDGQKANVEVEEAERASLEGHAEPRHRPCADNRSKFCTVFEKWANPGPFFFIFVFFT